MNDDNGRFPPFGKGQGPDRDEHGRYLPGHSLAGPGNPFAQRVAQLRTELLDAVTPADLAEVIQALLRLAKGGNLAAIHEVLDRTLGRALQAVELSGGDLLDVSSPAGREAYMATVRDLYGIEP